MILRKRVLVPIGHGFEEIEALTLVDILRRAGAEVVLAGIIHGPVRGRSDVTVIPDCDLDEALGGGSFDLIVLPGGLPSAYELRDDPRVIRALQEAHAAGSLVAAICAAPVALGAAGLLDGQPATSHPGVRDQMPDDRYSEQRVVRGDRILTSRGPGTAMEFAFALVREMWGEDAVKEVNAGVLAVL